MYLVIGLVLTVHLFVPSGCPGNGFSAEIAEALKQRFGIDCALEPAHIV